MLSIFLVIAMLVFSTLIFYAERNPNSDKTLDFFEGDFGTIPVGFWWATITMTTVGYGDVYPKTVMGMVIGALCAVWGVLLLALTIPVISNNFTLFYTHARTRERIANKDKERRKKSGDEASAHVTHSRTPSYSNYDRNKHFKDHVDSTKTLLIGNDSTLEETHGLIMAGARNLDCDSSSSTPQRLSPGGPAAAMNNVVKNNAESVM